MAPYESLYERRFRSPIGWFEVVEAGFIGQYIVPHFLEKGKVIQEILKTAQIRKNSYTYIRRKPIRVWGGWLCVYESFTHKEGYDVW